MGFLATVLMKGEVTRSRLALREGIVVGVKNAGVVGLLVLLAGACSSGEDRPEAGQFQEFVESFLGYPIDEAQSNGLSEFVKANEASGSLGS